MRKHSELFSRGLIVVLWAGALAAFGVTGCNSNETGSTSNTAVDPATTSTVESRAAECEELLDSVLGMIQPDRLGFTTDSRNAIEILNEWVGGCGAEGVRLGEPDAAAAAMLKLALSDEAREQLKAPRFVDRDAEHLRTATLLKSIAQHAASTAENDVDRVTQLFHYTVRNVAPLLEGEPVLTLTPYEILLFGRGSAEDRAWVFAELLRQLKIDAVILQAESGQEGGEGSPGSGDRPLMVGVLLEDGVYLYDARLGMPVPAPGEKVESTLVEKPATLAQAIADAEVLKQLDVGDSRPYPLTSENLKELKAHVISYEPFWTERAKRLERSLAGERTLVVFDGLSDSDGQRGALTRVAESAGEHWKRADLKLWSYPQRGFDGLAKLRAGEELDPQLAIRLLPFAAPITLTFDEKEKKVIEGRPQRLQMKTRIAHLLGRLDDAVKSYQMVRISGRISPQLPVSQRTRITHALAAEDAVFWVGLAQFEQGDQKAAAETFFSYMRQFEGGRWQQAAGLLRAIAVAESGDYATAVKLLSPLLERAPNDRGLELLTKRWRTLRDRGDGNASN